MKKNFLELGSKKASTREERFAALDSLDDKTRNQVDTFARAAIVETHPEWIDQALENAPAKTDETVSWIREAKFLSPMGKTPRNYSASRYASLK